MIKCRNCQKETNNPVFCSRRCFAIMNNKTHPKRQKYPRPNCKQCGIVLTNINSIYCCQHCHNIDRKKTKYKSVIDNDLVQWKWIRKFLMDTIGCCQWCGIKEWKNKVLSLELDHIDGDITNNRLSNARLLCPNCHSITPTYRSKNKNNPLGREKRNERHKKQVKVEYEVGLEPTFSVPITVNSLED